MVKHASSVDVSAATAGTVDPANKKQKKCNAKGEAEEDEVMEMGDFEGSTDEETEDDEEDVIVNDMEMDDGEVAMEGEGSSSSATTKPPSVKAYLPGQELQEGEVLEMDSNAYDMYHWLNMEAPCLSFDLVRDRLGDNRTSFPMTMYMVAGTQAERPEDNRLLMMKTSKLQKTKQEDDSDMSDDESDDEQGPHLDHCAFRHDGGVNRVRVMPHNDVQIVATWSDTGKVHIWDATEAIRSLDQPSTGGATSALRSNKPVYSVTNHTTEGFAMDWNKLSAGKLLTGDCANAIYLTERQDASGWTTTPTPFVGHTASVEDLQWSPTQQQVFASCSVDQTIKIWDTRMRAKCGVSVHVHQSDVNVISWNPNVAHLMASGADDGTFSVWDLRHFKGGNAAASFQWHRAPITSIEWHPHDQSVLAACGADDQLTIWDFSVEQDSEVMADGDDVPDIPPQLLFIHQGQHDPKEVHWHPQLNGVLVSTSSDGFNIFKTISV